MVMVKTTACVLLVLLCAGWLSTARFHPGAEVNATYIYASKISAATDPTNKSQHAIFDDGNKSKKVRVKPEANGRNKGNNAKLSSPSSSSLASSPSNIVKRKRRLRSRLSDDEFDKGFVAFTADYRGPRHHPPKNN